MSKTSNFVKTLSLVTVLFVLVFTFASCGASNGMAKDEAFYDYYEDNISASGSVKDYGLSLEAETMATVDAYYSKIESESFEAPELGEKKDPLEGRKIIKTVNVVSETKELDTAIASIESTVASLGGYVQSSNTYGKSYESYSNRRANYTLRIPAENLDAFMSTIGELLNVTSKTEKVDDITDTYTDIQARLTTLKTEETRLLELLAKAEKLADIITLEERISNVRYEIESYEARIRNYDTLIAFSTVNIEIAEVIDYTPEPIKDPTFGERIGKAFSESWNEFAENSKDFAVGFVYALPTLLVLAAIAICIVLVVVFAVKRTKKYNIAPTENKDQQK